MEPGQGGSPGLGVWPATGDRESAVDPPQAGAAGAAACCRRVATKSSSASRMASRCSAVALLSAESAVGTCLQPSARLSSEQVTLRSDQATHAARLAPLQCIPCSPCALHSDTDL